MSITDDRKWVYPAAIRGRYQRLHRWSGVGLQLILFAVPWIAVGGHPLLRIDLPGRKLYALGEIFTPTDTIFLVLLGLFTAFFLFFITSLFGRLWCGWLCPQTVFLEEWVRPIEGFLEGDRGKRMARDRGPWTLDLLWRKTAKWVAFAVLSFVLSMTLVSYFSGAAALWTFQAGGASYAFVAAIGVPVFLDMAWFREQFCNFLCPYARFQGALTDADSLVIAYDDTRGEPRKGEGAGDGACISCNKCVVVCPQGIDIRDGFQLECINSARCIDACEGVMEKRGTLPSLVTYTTLSTVEGRPTRWLRPRTMVYAGLLASLALAFVLLLVSHHTLEASVTRAPGTLFAVDDDGLVRNTFMLRVTNNHPAPDGESVSIVVAVEGLEGADVTLPVLSMREAETTTLPLVIRVPIDDAMPRTLPFQVRLKSAFDEVLVGSTFKSGGAGAPPALEG